MFCLTSVIIRENVSAQQLDSYLARIAAGDMEGLSLLYETIHEQIFGFALSIVKRRHDAQDVLQDLFTTVYHAAEGYRSQGKPMAWLLTLTRNLCLQQLRQAGKTAALPEVMGEEQTTDAMSDPAANVEDKLLLSACMKFLTDEERQILVLHAVSGLRHREIATVMQLNLSTVLSKYHRAIKKTKQFIERGIENA